jgi:hypothetical protein
MNETSLGWDAANAAMTEWTGPFELELGSLVAALSAQTEDETELDLQVRAVVEGGRFRIAIGCESAQIPL